MQSHWVSGLIIELGRTTPAVIWRSANKIPHEMAIAKLQDHVPLALRGPGFRIEVRSTRIIRDVGLLGVLLVDVPQVDDRELGLPAIELLRGILPG